MSVAWFCGSLPARSFGYADGRGTTDIFRRTAKLPAQADIVRRTVKPPAQACRLISWNKYHGSIVPTNSSLSPSPIALDDEVELNLEPFLIKYKNGVIKRLMGTAFIPPSCPEVATKDVVIDPATGVSVRLYLPNVVDLPSKKLRILVYFHGGAFIGENIGSPHYHNFLTLLAVKAGVLIISVNYRLAPEYPIPIPYVDCQRALKWVISHSAGPALEPWLANDGDWHSAGPALEPWLANHGDFSKLLLSGDSSGANITHNIAMRAEPDVNIEGIAIVHPYFIGSKWTEWEMQDTTNMKFHNKLWPSIAPNSTGMDDPLVNPFTPEAPSLKGLKCRRAIVFVAGNDFHRDRGRMYYYGLLNSGWGGKVELLEQDGVGHVFHLTDYTSEKFVELMTKLIAFLKAD